MNWAFLIFLPCFGIGGTEACASKSATPSSPSVVVPCDLDMEIVNNLPNHTLLLGSVNMATGAVWGGSSLFKNLAEGNSSILTFRGAEYSKKYPWEDSPPKPYCNVLGNGTTGTTILHIYEGINNPNNSARSLPSKVSIGIKWNSGCNSNNCNDWIELRIESTNAVVTREYFWEDPITTVENGIQRCSDIHRHSQGRRRNNVDFVMRPTNKLAIVAMAETQDFLVTARLESLHDVVVENPVLKVIVYPNNGGVKPVIIVDANL